MITNAIWPASEHERLYAYSQIPILAWGVERVNRRNQDLDLVRSALQPLERFHDWYWRERDTRNSGLVGVGSYSGHVQDARFESFDFECDLDDLKLTTNPRVSNQGGAWYGDICLPGISSYLILAEQSLARLAEFAGDKSVAKRRKKRSEKGIAAMRTLMCDESAGTFLAVHRDSLEKISVPTIGSWMGLMAGVPDQRMAARMANVLASPNWMTPLPIPTVGRHDSLWLSRGGTDLLGTHRQYGNMWRGDVWPVTNFQVASRLARYGYKELAARIVGFIIWNALRNGVSERYDCDTGEALGVRNLGMSCTVVTMVLDGLSNRYKLLQSLK